MACSLGQIIVYFYVEHYIFYLKQAVQKLDQAQEKVLCTEKEFCKVRNCAKKAKQSFEYIKKKRYNQFIKCFEHVSDEIDLVYKVNFLFLVLKFRNNGIALY